ncbi:MAG: hypothetical protein KGL95_04450, partial [Patescibacteria group bacterium]|nr:hypothetical protein [Patescibacteria group bacterium]
MLNLHRITVLFGILFCLVLITIQPVFSDTFSNDPSNSQDTLIVSTDKSSYTDGDKIIISGQVGQPIPGFSVVIRIQTPNGNLLSTKQVDVPDGGQYSTTINAGGSSWLEEGTYTILAQYGVKNISSHTTFDFKKSIPLPSGQSQPTSEQPQTATSQIPQQSNPEPQMKIDLSGNNLFVIVGAIIAAIIAAVAGIVIYFLSKSKKPGGVPNSPGNVGQPPTMVDHKTLELQDQIVYLEITLQYPDRKSSTSRYNRDDERIGSEGGYLLSIKLESKDEPLMTEIADVIEKYGFNTPLVNFQNHKSFKTSQNVSVGEANQIFEEICYYLEKKFPKKPPVSGSKDPTHVQDNIEPPKVPDDY